MKTFAIVSLMIVSAPAFAGRAYTPSLTCAEVADLVQTQGSVILYTGRDTYEQVVAHGGYCNVGETTQAAWVPSKDSRYCFAGWSCAQSEGGGE